MSSIIRQLRRMNGERTSGTHLLKQGAERLGCELSTLQAVLEVESKGAPFDEEGRLVLLPEKHIFFRELPKAKRTQAIAMGLASKRWKRANYKGLGPAGSDARWDRLSAMAAIDETAALKACSYGLAQIMGFNFQLCGFARVQDFVLHLAQSRDNQITSFVMFLESVGLGAALRKKDWRSIARIYNGPGQVDHYAALLEAAYNRIAGAHYDFAIREGATRTSRVSEKLLGMGSSGYRVKALQARLSELGYSCRADGDFGPATKRMVVAFQSDYGLSPDGIVGEATEAALEKAVPIAQRQGEARQDLSLRDLRKTGSVTVQKADGLTRIGQLLLGTGVGVGALGEKAEGFFAHIGTGADQLASLRSKLSPLLKLMTDNQWLILLIVGLGVVYLARQIKQRRLEDAQNWRHLG